MNKRFSAFLRWLRDPNATAKAAEFAGLRMQLEMRLMVGQPIPPDLQRRYDELLRWYIGATGQLPPPPPAGAGERTKRNVREHDDG